MRSTWTTEEELILINAVKDNTDNLQKAFEAASQLLENRTVKACSCYWYTHFKKTFSLVSVSSKPSKCSIFKRIINIFKAFKL